MTEMRIAIWSEALVNGQTGTKTMLENIVRFWLREHAEEVAITFVVATPEDARVIDALFSEGDWETMVVPGGKWARRLAWLIGGKSLTPSIGPHDIYLSGWHWPLGRHDRPFIGIVHDLRPLDPDWYEPTASPMRRWTWRMLYRLSARRCLATAAALATPSAFTLRHISRIGFAPRQPVRVIPHGVEHDVWKAPLDPRVLDAALRRTGLPAGAPFVLSIGPHAPHKNMPRLVQAFASGPARSDPDAHLVLAGATNVETPRIKRLICETGLEDRVHLPGRVPFNDLVALMKAARVFAFVSLFEGFGIPVAEAFSSGTPVVTSSTTSLHEVVGDAALTVDPTDVAAISEALSRLWHNEALRRVYRDRAATRVAEFRWDVAARAYLDLFQSVRGRT